MLKILMKPNKTLVVTKDARIYQRETGEILHLYVPSEYNNFNLSLFTCTMKWIDAGNVAHAEILEMAESEKEGYLLFVLPLESKFTFIAGNNKVMLTFTWYNEEDGRNYKIESSELDIPILPKNDYFAYTADTAFSSIDNKITALQAETDKLATITDGLPTVLPTDIELNDQRLQLVNEEGTLLGKGVEISDGGYDTDTDNDGIVDLSEAEIIDDGTSDNINKGSTNNYAIDDPDQADDALINLDELNPTDDSDFSGDTDETEEDDPDGLSDGLIDLGRL